MAVRDPSTRDRAEKVAALRDPGRVTAKAKARVTESWRARPGAWGPPGRAPPAALRAPASPAAGGWSRRRRCPARRGPPAPPRGLGGGPAPRAPRGPGPATAAGA